MQKIIFIPLLLFFLFTGCNKTQPQHEKNKINSVVTLITYKNFVEIIGGNEVVVSSIIPPGANPHTFEPIPAHIKQMSEANVYFKVGGSFHFEEELMGDFPLIQEKLRIVDCSKGIEIKNNNPHVWLGPDQVKIILKNIYDALILLKPEREKYFRQNFENYITKLDSIDTQMKRKFNSSNKRTFIVYHEAWGYFAEHYNLIEIAVEKEGKEPSIDHMKKIIEEARRNEIKIIFSEPQTNRQSALTIAREIGASVDYINPHPSNYLENLLEVSNKLLASFK